MTWPGRPRRAWRGEAALTTLRQLFAGSGARGAREFPYCPFACGSSHTFRNEGAEEVRTITGFEPAGFEAFFEEYGIDSTQPGAFEASIGAEAIERFVAGCSRFGMIIPLDTTAPTN